MNKREKSFFLKSGDNISAANLQKIISHYKSIELTSEDRQIASKIHEETQEKNDLPDWWTPQEAAYLKGVDDLEASVRYIIFRYKFRVFTRDRITPTFPIYVLIEPTSVCNLKCPFCFQSDKSFNKKYMGRMDMDLFIHVIDECAENGTGAITLASRGEPTLHPNITDMLAYMKGKFFEVKMNTNGTKLTEKICHSLFVNGVNDIVLSIDSEQKELFEKMRKGAQFEKVLDNVKMLYRIRAEYYPDSRTTIRISGVEYMDGQNAEKFTEFWGSFADEITIYPAEERWDTYGNTPHPDLSGSCPYPWERFYIWHDGTCNPCDVDYKSKLSPGIISKDVSIKSIWDSKILRELKQKHLEGKRSAIIPCDRCGIE